MKKLAKLLSGILVSSMIFSNVNVFANTNEVKVTIGSNIANVNGQNVKMDAMPYIQEYTNVTMIPLRFVATALGIPDSDVTYVPETKSVKIITDEKDIYYFLNQHMGNYGYAELKNGRTYIPLRVLCDNLGLSIEWDNLTKTATMINNTSLVNNSINNIGNSNQSNNQTQVSNTASTTLTEQDVRAMEEEVVRLVNEERAKYGLQPLEIDETLMQVAKLKSKDMSENKYLAHTSPTYGSATDMMKNIFGYKFNGYYAGVGENIASMGLSAEGVVNGWLNSEGHRANILNPNYKYIGVGYSIGRWTQIFAG